MSYFPVILLRMATVYIYLLVVGRLAGKRFVGRRGSFDFIVALLISDLPDDIIWGEVPMAHGVIAIGTITVLHVLVAYGAYRSAAFHRFVVGAPSPMISHGVLILRMMGREQINEHDLESMLRQHGTEDRREVQGAMLEPTGKLSVQRWDHARPATKGDRVVLRGRS